MALPSGRQGVNRKSVDYLGNVKADPVLNGRVTAVENALDGFSFRVDEITEKAQYSPDGETWVNFETGGGGLSGTKYINTHYYIDSTSNKIIEDSNTSNVLLVLDVSAYKEKEINIISLASEKDSIIRAGSAMFNRMVCGYSDNGTPENNLELSNVVNDNITSSYTGFKLRTTPAKDFLYLWLYRGTFTANVYDVYVGVDSIVNESEVI